jgi:hypothetical protein
LRLPYQSTGDQPQARKMSDFERWEKRYGAAGHVFGTARPVPRQVTIAAAGSRRCSPSIVHR